MRNITLNIIGQRILADVLKEQVEIIRMNDFSLKHDCKGTNSAIIRVKIIMTSTFVHTSVVINFILKIFCFPTRWNIY